MKAPDKIIGTQVLQLQLEILKRNLADCEASWKATGFARLRNPVADSIRRDIAEKEALLADIEVDSQRPEA